MKEEKARAFPNRPHNCADTHLVKLEACFTKPSNLVTQNSPPNGFSGCLRLVWMMMMIMLMMIMTMMTLTTAVRRPLEGGQGKHRGPGLRLMEDYIGL